MTVEIHSGSKAHAPAKQRMFDKNEIAMIRVNVEIQG